MGDEFQSARTKLLAKLVKVIEQVDGCRWNVFDQFSSRYGQILLQDQINLNSQ